jgi:hypothetical protein
VTASGHGGAGASDGARFPDLAAVEHLTSADRHGTVIAAVCPGLVDTDASRLWFGSDVGVRPGVLTVWDIRQRTPPRYCCRDG